MIQSLCNDAATSPHKLNTHSEKKQQIIQKTWQMHFTNNFEQTLSQPAHIEVTHIKKTQYQKVVSKVDDVLENENLNTNYDQQQIYEKQQTNKNFYQNTKIITIDYTITPTYIDSIKAIKIEENLMDIIQNRDTEDIQVLDWQQNCTIEILHSPNT